MIMRVISDCPDRNIPPKTNTIIPAGTVCYNNEYLDIFNTDVDIEFEKTDYMERHLCRNCGEWQDVVCGYLLDRINNISGIDDRTDVVFQINCQRHRQNFVCFKCGAENTVYF